MTAYLVEPTAGGIDVPDWFLQRIKRRLRSRRPIVGEGYTDSLGRRYPRTFACPHCGNRHRYGSRVAGAHIDRFTGR